MKVEQRTKADLLEELREARRQIARLESCQVVGREQVEEGLQHSSRELAIRNRIAEVFLTISDEGMYDEVLKIVLDAMQSEFGVFGYVDDKGGLVVPTMTRHIWSQCQVMDKTIVFPRDTWSDSSWPCAIREKRTIVLNETSTRTPEGHITVSRHISLPIIHQGEVVGLIQVANKETDYTDWDVELAEIIGNIVAPILDARLRRDGEESKRKRVEEELRKLNDELEQRVKQRTAELEASNKELESFAYSVSHDLRAPLRGIDGFSQALVEDYGDQLDETGKGYLERVSGAARRMGRLIDDMLRLSRLTRSEMRYEQVDLSVGAHRFVVELQEGEPDRKAEIVIEPGLSVRGDTVLLGSVLHNLLANAWKFTGGKEHARIELGTEESEQGRTYFVRDNGAGFDMAYANKLFGAFQRLHDTAEFPGTGIGLAIVQRAVRMHGGRVWAKAEVDRGATFYFTLPQ